jgi:HEAT repeat protein
MTDIWNLLEKRTRAWHALGRQGLADAIWADYVSLRFGRTGNPLALEYLYPYLNHAQRPVRLRAIEVATRVFKGRGPRAIEDLDYFTRNPDLFLRDRAVQVIGSAVSGSPETLVLDTLSPYLNHRNQFIRKQALVALGEATEGQGSDRVLAEIQRVARQSGPREDEVDLATARAFAGRPTEKVYSAVAKPHLNDRIDTGNQMAVAVLVRGASQEWYGRASAEIFEPRLHSAVEPAWMRRFIQREGLLALCHAAAGMGMEPLSHMVHLRHSRCTGHAMLYAVPACFATADAEANRGPLIDLARSGDAAAQRIAARALGRMTLGAGDAQAIDVLRDLVASPNRAVQAAALDGLGMAARSTCDEELHAACLDLAREGETATAAVRALGAAFLGSGQSGVFEDIRSIAGEYRARPVRGKKHSKPLAACYLAAGLVYLGTGSREPVEWLLDALERPGTPGRDAYRRPAAKALVMVEFPEWKLAETLAEVLR